MADQRKTHIIDTSIEEEMKGSYIDYAMSVIISRALPDVRDGLKPVHRRILHAMNEMGVAYNRPYKKSAAVVGEVMGKYHPHGDAAIYDTMVRMVQNFSLRYPLINGQGNFGSVDGDSAAAMRYTESRLHRISGELLSDIDKETVDFVPNYDSSLKEPTVLPARLPNLLINGSTGIAVGMATNIPPHNLTEVIGAVLHLIDNPDATIADLLQFVKGPDFPTAGIIYGTKGMAEAYNTGHGIIRLRGTVRIEELPHNKQALIIEELPYMVNKAKLVEHIADLVNSKRIEGISDLRDESDRRGMRIYIELKRSGNPLVIENQLYKFTSLQSSFGIRFLALVGNRPRTLNLQQMLRHYLDHRVDVVERRTKYELRKAEARAHLLIGLRIALDNIDRIVQLIRQAPNPHAARDGLMSEFELSKIQAQAILDMRLQRLTGLERDKIEGEYKSLVVLVADLKDVLSKDLRVLTIIKDELIEIRERYGDARRTEIVTTDQDFDIEDLIADESVIITITHSGYIKRLLCGTYKEQKRGGKGVIGMTTKQEDFIENIFMATCHNYILFFTDRGRCLWLKVYRVPATSRTAKGTAIINLVQLEPGEKILAHIPIAEFSDDQYLVMVTRKGLIKKTALSAYSRPRTNGILAISIHEDDELVTCKLTRGSDHVILSSAGGYATRFNEEKVRPMGRTAHGVRGMKLREGDTLVDMAVVTPDKDLFTYTEKGYAKRSLLEHYPVRGRATYGVIDMRVGENTGAVVGTLLVGSGEQILSITQNGQVVKVNTDDFRTIGRATKGVKLINIAAGDKLVSATAFEHKEDVCAEEGEGEVAAEGQEISGQEPSVSATPATGEDTES